MSAIQPVIQSVLSAAITSVLGGSVVAAWSPLTLFAASEVGVWYDPSDFSTMYQDSAGTTPVTAVGQPVGLILDKSDGTTLGAEMHPEPYTVSGVGWSATANSISRALTGAQSTGTLTSSPNATAGRWYRVSFTASGLSGGTSYITYGTSNVASPASSVRIAAAGDYTFLLLATSSAARFQVVAYEGSDYAVTLTNISIKELAGNHAYQATAASRPILRHDGTNYYLEFDGVDDSLATAAIDFSATDKITHHAGWTQSTSSFGMVTELSNNVGPNAGTFSLAGYTVGEMFFVARGTAALTARFDAATLPKTRVSTGLLDIAQALAAGEIVARVNGVVKSVLSYLDAGPAGTGNFGNYPLYLGRRGGVQYPLSGRIYSIVIRGALSDAAQIAAAEAYVNSKTGAY